MTMLNISFVLSLDSIDCSTFPVHTYILTPVYLMRVFTIEVNYLYTFGEYSFGVILVDLLLKNNDYLIVFYCNLIKMKVATKIYKKMLKFLEDVTIN